MLAYRLALFRAFVLCFMYCAGALANAVAFTAGNVAIYRVGTGTGILVNTGNPVFIDEYTPSGMLAQSIALPTTANGSNAPLIGSGTATSDGLLTRSVDGNCLWMTGYGTTVGGATSLTGTTSGLVPRVVGRINAAGAIDTTTALTNYSSVTNIRSAAGNDCNSAFVTGGTGTGAGIVSGIINVALGATTANPALSTTLTNLRQVNIFNGQLYIATGSGTTIRIGAVGIGTSSTTGQVVATLPGIPTTASVSPYAFFFAKLSGASAGVDTLYIAHEDVSGLAKYSLNGGIWVSKGVVGVDVDDYRGLTGVVSGSTVTLYAVRKGGSSATGGGELVSLVDASGYDGAFAGTPTLRATAAANTAFRGVALVPEATPSVPTVALSLSTNAASEAAQTVVTLTATASGPVATAQTVTVAISGTGITAGDFSLSSTTITIPAGQTSGTATFTVIDDADVEGLETATITLTGPSAGITLSTLVSANVSITDNDVGNTAPVIGSIPPLAVVITLADNPSTVFTVSDGESAPGTLALSVLSSSNAAVLPVANVTLTNVDGTVTAVVLPISMGYSDLTIQVSDGALTATQILRVAASAAPLLPSQTRYLFGTCDASTAVAVDAATMLVADDENQALRLYSRTASGYPIASFDYTTALGLTDVSSGLPREVDIEASTRIGSRIYWLGSHSNASGGNQRPNRSRLFATDITGLGAAATLSFAGYYAGLKTDLLAWDSGNGHGLGANFFGFTASTATGIIPETVDGSGFNIEGLTVAPDGTTGWLAFRAPISPASARTKALIVPITNFAALVGGSPAAGPAAFGAPIQLDLGGRGIRSIERSFSVGGYVIVAGPAATATGAAPNDFRLYRWSGVATDAPRITSASLAGLSSTGSPEGIVEVPANAGSTTAIQMIADSGAANWYGDAPGAACKDLTEPRFKAFRADSIALGTSDFRIHEVQGSGTASPLVGQSVTVEGIVTGSFQAATNLGGFFMQEEDVNADNDPLTSEGIFVFHSATPVVVGNKVRVTGTVVEFGTAQATLTEISTATVSIVSTTNPLPAAITLTLPVAALGDLERYEGMRVQVAQTLTVSEHFNVARYGEVTLSANGRLMQPTQFIDPNDSPASGTSASGNSNVAAINAQVNLNARSSILLADVNSIQNTFAIPFFDPNNNTLRTGSTVSALSGILTHSFGNHAIHPTTPPMFNYAPRPLMPPAVGGAVKVAAFNVLNFFNGNGSGTAVGFPTSRGADTVDEFARQKAKIVAALCGLGADVVGLMEMENDTAASGTPALNELTAVLSATSGCGSWSFVANPANWGSFPGSTDEIRPALIYRNTAVVPVGAALSPNDSAYVQARAPVAQTFRVVSGASTGGKLSVIVNHFKSKGGGGSGADADQLDGQGFYNASRKAQATALLSFITTVQAAANDPDVLIIGDLNAYSEEDPIDILRAAGLVKLDEGGYSYIFDGRTGSLDHALATPSLAVQITDTGVWHINADEPRVLDYNVEFKSPADCIVNCLSRDYYTPTPFRSSDHDPLLIGIALVAPALAVTPSPQSFGTVVVGAGPADRTLTLANSTAQSATLSNINVTGTGYARNGGTCPTTFPAAISGNSSCTIIVRFTPTVVGAPVGSVDVTGDIATSAVLNVTVVGVLAPTPANFSGLVLTPVSLSLGATGGTPFYTWSITSGALPTGLTLTGNTVSGTPTVAGNGSVTFTVNDSGGQSATLLVNFTITAPPTLDIDDSAPNTPYDAATDGMLLMRYVLGFRDAALTTGAISPSARRDATQIAAHIAANLTRLDVDGDGKTLATTDGIMILRRLLGVPDPAAITQGVKNSSRSDADVVLAIDALKP